MAIATFVYSDWLKRYPELANCPDPLATLCFAEAGIYLDNTGAGPVADQGALTMLMYMLTAHIVFLSNGDVNNPPSPIVGHIEQASQGSVSVSAKIADSIPGTMAWYAQTKYGLNYWQATAQYRTAAYRPTYRSALVGGPFGGSGFGRPPF